MSTVDVDVNHFSGTAPWLPPGVQPDEHAMVGLIEKTTRLRDRRNHPGERFAAQVPDESQSTSLNR